MPLYDFACTRGHVTEARRGVDVKSIPCPCGRSAQRQIAVPSLRVEHAEIPFGETSYYVDSKKQDLKKQGWDYDRTLEHLRQSQTETAIGKGIDTKKANAPTEKRVY